MLMIIESKDNPIIKEARSLLQAKYRAQLGMHIIEGTRLVSEAINSGAKVELGFVASNNDVSSNIFEGCGAKVYHVNPNVLNSLSDTQTHQGIFAVIKTANNQPFIVADAKKTMVIALDSIQDPGNMGAVIRTADAMGAIGVIVGDNCVDPYNPKCLRSAMGSTYHLPLYKCNLNGALQALHNDGFLCICGHLQGNEILPHPIDRCVIVIGNEGNGVSDDVSALCTKVRIPMYGKANSLNASIAASLLMYEVAKAIRT